MPNFINTIILQQQSTGDAILYQNQHVADAPYLAH
jgi:hypothetical protein